jgi:hypothetical protein
LFAQVFNLDFIFDSNKSQARRPPASSYQLSPNFSFSCACVWCFYNFVSKCIRIERSSSARCTCSRGVAWRGVTWRDVCLQEFIYQKGAAVAAEDIMKARATR